MFANLTKKFLEEDIDKVMPALGLPNEPIPLWWTGDFILASPEGTPADADGKVLAPGQRYGGESVILMAGNLADKDSWSAVVGTELVDSPTKKSLSSHAREIIAMQRWIQGS